jgi:hypothetical protein
MQLFNCVLSLMLHKFHISWQLVLTEITCLARQFSLSTKHFWSLFYKDSVFRAHLSVKGNVGKKIVLTKFTWLMKESWIELVLIELTQLPKDFRKFTVLTKPLLVNIEDHLKTSVYRLGLANEGFYCSSIWRLIISSIASSQLW